jgi:hypothetical protein
MYSYNHIDRIFGTPTSELPQVGNQNLNNIIKIGLVSLVVIAIGTGIHYHLNAKSKEER